MPSYYVFYGSTDKINEELEKFLDVTREDIMNVANKYLNSNKRVVLYYLPKSEEKN